MNYHLKIVFVVFLFALIFSSCKKDFEGLENEDWKPVLAIPLVNSVITVDDVLTEFNHPEEVLILPNNVVALNYKGELFSFEPDELLVLGDSEIDETLAIDDVLANELSKIIERRLRWFCNLVGFYCFASILVCNSYYIATWCLIGNYHA